MYHIESNAAMDLASGKFKLPRKVNKNQNLDAGLCSSNEILGSINHVRCF